MHRLPGRSSGNSISKQMRRLGLGSVPPNCPGTQVHGSPATGSDRQEPRPRNGPHARRETGSERATAGSTRPRARTADLRSTSAHRTRAQNVTRNGAVKRARTALLRARQPTHNAGYGRRARFRGPALCAARPRAWPFHPKSDQRFRQARSHLTVGGTGGAVGLLLNCRSAPDLYAPRLTRRSA